VGIAGAVLKGRVVVVVDDHADTRDMIAEVFEKHGATVLTAPDGPTGRAAIAERPVDLIVTDIAMPGETGIQMMTRVRAAEGMREIPAIAISGQIRSDELEQFRPALFQAVLAKPFDLDRLVAIAGELVAS
jgi:CheY-like chemotaxis protein